MKPYGVKRGDCGCCPGHDKYPRDSYNTARSRRAHAKARRSAHRRARSWERDAMAVAARVDHSAETWAAAEDEAWDWRMSYEEEMEWYADLLLQELEDEYKCTL